MAQLCQHCGAHIRTGQETIICLGDCGEAIHLHHPAADRGCGLENMVLPCLKCERNVRLKRVKIPAIISVTVQGQALEWVAFWRMADDHECGVEGFVPQNTVVIPMNDGKAFLFIRNSEAV